MLLKQALRTFLKIFLVLLFSCPVLTSSLKELCKFKGVELPYTLMYKDAVLEKGKYDLEALKQENPTAPMYYLRIKKRGKVLCLLQGERLEYKVRGAEHMRDTSIPDKCTMNMKKNHEENVFYFIVETGKKNRMSRIPLKLRFKMEYEE